MHDPDELIAAFADVERADTRWLLKVAGIVLTACLIVLGGVAAAQETTKTHSCKSPKETAELAVHLTTHGPEGYMELLKPKLQSGMCVGAILPVPPTVPPIAVFPGENGFRVGIFMVQSSDGRPWFALLTSGSIEPVGQTI